MPRATLPVLAILLTLAGCASTSTPPISVGGAPPAVASLAGQWDGQYHTVDNGRSGTIKFDLAKGDTVATGNVIMSSTPDPAPVERRRLRAPRAPRPRGRRRRRSA